MPFRPVTEKEHYIKQIERLQKEVDLRQQSIESFKQKIEEGIWYSDRNDGEVAVN